MVREKGREEEEERRKREGQRDERRFALRRDRKRDSLGLVIYLKRSRAPCATTTRGTEELRRIVFGRRGEGRRNRGGDGDDDGDDGNDSFAREEDEREPRIREKLS